MFHYFNSIQNKSGDALPGYLVKLFDGTGTVAPIYSDDVGTPIVNASGIADTAVVDDNGNVSFYVEPGTYDLGIYSPSGNQNLLIPSVPMGLNTITLASGASVATRTLLSAIAAPLANQTATLAESGREGVFVFDDSDLSSQVTADTDQGLYVAPTSDPTGASGAWVRVGNEPIDIEHFGITGYDTVGAARAGANDLAKVNRAFAVASSLGRAIYLRRFYAVDGTVLPLGVDIVGAGRGKAGFVTISSSLNTTDLMLLQDETDFSMRGFGLWHVIAASGLGGCLRMDRCSNGYVEADCFDSRSYPIRLVDCVNVTVAEFQAGGSDVAAWNVGTRPFGTALMDGCTSCRLVRGYGEFVNFAFAISGDDATRKSYFTASSTTDELTIQDPLVFANLVTGDSVMLITHNDGVLPSPLVASDIRTYRNGGWSNSYAIAAGATIYWVIKTATGVKLALTYADAIAGTAIDLTTDGTTGNARTQATFTLRTTTCSVNTATEEITVGADFYAMCATADPCFLHFADSTGIASPIANDTTYFIIKTGTANVIKLATSSANASGGTAIDLTTDGSGGMVLGLGVKSTYSQNDHISYRPMSDNRNNVFDHCRLGRHTGHAFNISTGYANRGLFCEASDNEEATTVSRNAFQLKHTYGQGTDLNGFVGCHAERVRTCYGMQGGNGGLFTACTGNDFTHYGFFNNNTPGMIVLNPILRAKGQSTDTRRPIMFYALTSGARIYVQGGNYEASANGLSTFLFGSSAGNWTISGTPICSGTWTAGIVADTGGFVVGKGFFMSSGYHYITAKTGRFGSSAQACLPTTATLTVGLATQAEFCQIVRYRFQSLGTIANTARVRGGRVGATSLAAASVAPPTGAGTRKDYMAASAATASAGADTLTVDSDWFNCVALNTIVRVTSPTGNLPGGLSENTDYFVVNPTANTIQLAASASGSAIDLTSAGSAVFVMIKAWSLDSTVTGLAAEVATADAAGSPILVEASWIPRT